jgi:hypothetical protein
MAGVKGESSSIQNYRGDITVFPFDRPAAWRIGGKLLSSWWDMMGLWLDSSAGRNQLLLLNKTV